MAYIPPPHKHYNLLPFCQENGNEVFEYPCNLLNEVNKLLPNGKTLMPYGYKSLDEYFSVLDKFIEDADDDDTKEAINLFGNSMVVMNIKETWAVLKYIGENTDDDYSIGLTKNKFYYCPDPTSSHGFFGIIDDEEFTSYLYPHDSSDWILYEDPSGKAEKTLNQKPKVNLMCPCCNKHYFLHYADCICPVCDWEYDIIQHKNPDEEGGANQISLNEAKRRFNPNNADLTNLYKSAFENLPEQQIKFISHEFNIEKDTLLKLSERELDCIYNILDLMSEPYQDDESMTERDKEIFLVQDSIYEYFKSVF